MKKYISIGLLAAGIVCAMCLSSFQKKDTIVPVGEFLICGELTNVPDGVVICLFAREGNMNTLILSDTLSGGKFSFRDTVTVTRKMQIGSYDRGFPNARLDVWLAPGKLVKVGGKDKMLRNWTVKSDIPEQKEENQFTACALNLENRIMECMIMANDLEQEMTAPDRVDDQVYQKITNAKVDSIRLLWLSLYKEIWKKELDHMVTAPVGTVWMDRMCQFASMMKYGNTMPYKAEVKELYARIPDEQKQTPLGQEITQYIFPPVEVGVGDMMVDGNLYDLEGKLRHLSEFKGKYILLDFWSNGCVPCLWSIPELEKITDMYKDQMVVISICEDPEKSWKRCIENRKMTGNQWNELRRGRTGLSASYQVKGIPHYVFIGPDSKIQDVWGGYSQGSLLKKMEENLK